MIKPMSKLLQKLNLLRIEIRSLTDFHQLILDSTCCRLSHWKSPSACRAELSANASIPTETTIVENYVLDTERAIPGNDTSSNARSN